MLEKPKVDIVLPCYNPGSNWYQELIAFYDYAKQNYDLHFLVVDDGSLFGNIQTQVTSLKNAGIAVTYLAYQTNKGKGYALRHGVAHTNAPYVVYTDVDFPFTNASIFEVMSVLTSNSCDVVLGNRNNQYYQQKMSRFRKFLSLSFRVFLKRFLQMPVTDTQCGLKGFNALGKVAFLQTTINRYLFDFEFIYRICHQQNLQFRTVDVQLKENVQFSKMRVKILLQESFNLMRVLMRSKENR